MTWLHCFHPRPGATARLICFAHAGGSAAAYRDWSGPLPESVELYGVQLPGRADRLGQPLLEHMDTLVGSVTEAMLPLLDRPFALFGHSMGAVAAYEVTRALEARGIRPARLFASGCLPPHEAAERRKVSAYDDEGLLAELARLGGTELEVLSHRSIREIVFPYVRGDFRLLENYRHRPGPPLRTPISVLVGDADPVLTPAQAKSWEALTASGFSLTVFPGDHFYLQPQRERVVAEIARGMRAEPRDG
ncbi:surfactin synthase thioesterase subunit [Streptosporangium album]|uniref:Surfactin synthase thioesterase subunit n=1 Tax=Streptosporangium album TaxID=47479 RepID=A0A7W7RQQ7_9ACTN|nr:alpha/beta fold hydrolase [Streptosporangium album]MBB4935816.1 surfactin synthase thioesterase subunit [Streptosporangium album]